MDLSGKGSEGILQISDKKWKGSMGVSAKNDVTKKKYHKLFKFLNYSRRHGSKKRLCSAKLLGLGDGFNRP